jgi:hypothetical protein
MSVKTNNDPKACPTCSTGLAFPPFEQCSGCQAEGVPMPAPVEVVEPPAPKPAATLGLSKVLACCEGVHAAIREHHEDLPVVAMTIGSGSDSRQGLTKWGHHAPLRWARRDGEKVAEIMVSGEGLGRTAEEVLVTLIHEAAHAVAMARAVKDTSRQGRYHSRAFAKIAAELGLVPPAKPDGKTGFSACTLGDEARTRYAEQLAALADVLTVSRTAEAKGGKDEGEKEKPEGRVKAECDGGCGRSFRIALSVLKQAHILCEDGGRFRAEGDDDGDLDDEDDEACESRRPAAPAATHLGFKHAPKTAPACAERDWAAPSNTRQPVVERADSATCPDCRAWLETEDGAAWYRRWATD